MSQISALTEENSALKQALIHKSNKLEAVQGTLNTQIEELQTTRWSDIQEAVTKANVNHAADTLQLKGTIVELRNTLKMSEELAGKIKEELIQSKVQNQHTMEKLESINDSHLIQQQQVISQIQSAHELQSKQQQEKVDGNMKQQQEKADANMEIMEQQQEKADANMEIMRQEMMQLFWSNAEPIQTETSNASARGAPTRQRPNTPGKAPRTKVSLSPKRR